MRPVLICDLTVAARALLFVQAEGRERLAAQFFQDADVGGRFTRLLGRAHPALGDGTLSGAERKWSLAIEPTLGDCAYCECLEMVVLQLMAWRILFLCS